jgi:hypothetical protein
MKKMARVYRRAASAAHFRSAKAELRGALRALEHKCLPPKQHIQTSGLNQAKKQVRLWPSGELVAELSAEVYEALKQRTSWPPAELLAELDSSVCTLVLLDHKKVPKPLWRAFELVSQRWPGSRLISRLNALVLRARKLLEEAGESDLARVRREAEGSGERAADANAFLVDLRRIMKDRRAAAKVEWKRYEQFLFQPPGNMRVELWSKLPAPSAVKCYARALEVIVDDQLREPAREEARPVLEWIAGLGNPAYSDAVKWGEDEYAKWVVERTALVDSAERKRRKLEKTRARVKRHRERKFSR